MTNDEFLPANKTKISNEKKLALTTELLRNKNVLINITISMKVNYSSA
jgi:hypothetical protein